jgi:putative transposase
MAIPKRHASIPGTYFVTSRTWENRKLFVAEAACQSFVEILAQYRDQKIYALHGFVLMPDHFHVLITPSQSVSLEKAVQFIKGGSARQLGLQLNMKFPVWQKGFSDHRIRDTNDFVVHVKYVEQNPVAKKLCMRAEEFRWSSASNTIKIDDPPQGLKPRVEESQVRHG